MNKIILSPVRNDNRNMFIHNQYIDMFKKYNLDLIFIPPITNQNLILLVNMCHGLLLTGGLDVNPMRFNQSKHDSTKVENQEIELLELKLIHLFTKHNKPILGICRGIQIINVAFNGTLHQHIKNHNQKDLDFYYHPVTIIPNTNLSKYLNNQILTNSFHHQAIFKLAPGFTINAISNDYTIEGIEKDNIIAFQWHPEKVNDINQEGIMKLFIDLLNKNN